MASPCSSGISTNSAPKRETAQIAPTFPRIVQEMTSSSHQSARGVISQMIWIYAIRGENPVNLGGITRSYDFHVRACWNSPVAGGVQTLGTIVRLYEPS